MRIGVCCIFTGKSGVGDSTVSLHLIRRKMDEERMASMLSGMHRERVKKLAWDIDSPASIGSYIFHSPTKYSPTNAQHNAHTLLCQGLFHKLLEMRWLQC